MFDVNDKVNKMLGPNPGKEQVKQKSKVSNFKVNPNEVMKQMQNLLDKMPEVKKAKGNIQFEFEDGQKRVVNLLYNEGGKK